MYLMLKNPPCVPSTYQVITPQQACTKAQDLWWPLLVLDGEAETRPWSRPTRTNHSIRSNLRIKTPSCSATLRPPSLFIAALGGLLQKTLRTLASGPLPPWPSATSLRDQRAKDPGSRRLSSKNNLQQLNTSEIRACVACQCRDGDLATHNENAVVCTKLSLRRNRVQLGRIELVQLVDDEQLRLITLGGSAALGTADANSSFDLVNLPDKDAFVFCNSSTSLTFSTRLWEDSDINAAKSPCEWSSSTLASWNSSARSAIRDPMREATSLNPLELGSVMLGNTISLQQLQLGKIEIVQPVDGELEQLRRGCTVGVRVTKSEC